VALLNVDLNVNQILYRLLSRLVELEENLKQTMQGLISICARFFFAYFDGKKSTTVKKLYYILLVAYGEKKKNNQVNDVYVKIY
jgi:hypothetical protein